MKSFSATECVKYGWETFKKRPWFLIGATAIMIVLSWMVSAIDTNSGDSFVQIFAVSVAALIVQTLIDMGLTHFTLKAGDDVDTVELADLWHPQSFWSFLVVAFLTGIVVVLGFVALIIPGIVLALMFYFVKFLVIDRDMNPIDAMKESARITKNNRFELLVLALLTLALNVVGALCLGVGLLVSVPVTSLSLVRAYRLLEHDANEIVPVPVAVK